MPHSMSEMKGGMRNAKQFKLCHIPVAQVLYYYRTIFNTSTPSLSLRFPAIRWE